MKEWTSGDQREHSASADLKGESGKAAARAMKLLLFKSRTEQELRKKLLEEGFSEAATEDALEYVSSFGYLNDAAYAENYIRSNKERRGSKLLRKELAEKGVDAELIEAAFEEEPADEASVLDALLRKKAGEPHDMDEKELRRVCAFLFRRGFSQSGIWAAVRRYREAAESL